MAAKYTEDFDEASIQLVSWDTLTIYYTILFSDSGSGSRSGSPRLCRFAFGRRNGRRKCKILMAIYSFALHTMYLYYDFRTGACEKEKENDCRS